MKGSMVTAAGLLVLGVLFTPVVARAPRAMLDPPPEEARMNDMTQGPMPSSAPSERPSGG